MRLALAIGGSVLVAFAIDWIWTRLSSDGDEG